MEGRQLRRSRRNRVFAGVCGGIADYFGLDPVLVRVAWFVISLLTAEFPGILVYIGAALIIPNEE